MSEPTIESRRWEHPLPWDEEITLLVTVRVRAEANPTHFEAGIPRTPLGCAEYAVIAGVENLENLDGYADLVGSAHIEYVDEGY